MDWQLIDSAPPDRDVLLFCPNRHSTNKERMEIGIAHSERGRWRHAWATHWAELPAGPDKAEVDEILRDEEEREYREREMEQLAHDGQL